MMLGLTNAVFLFTVFKRNVLLDCGKFAQFSGKHIVEVNLDNMDAVLAYERQ